jgi:hypothetical protein
LADSSQGLAQPRLAGLVTTKVAMVTTEVVTSQTKVWLTPAKVWPTHDWLGWLQPRL